jgi:hypothetical protein
VVEVGGLYHVGFIASPHANGCLARLIAVHEQPAGTPWLEFKLVSSQYPSFLMDIYRGPEVRDATYDGTFYAWVSSPWVDDGRFLVTPGAVTLTPIVDLREHADASRTR